MKKITIAIETDNAAFEDAPGREVARILEIVARHFQSEPERGDKHLFDANGNRCGILKIR